MKISCPNLLLIIACLSLCSCSKVMRTYVSNAPYVSNLQEKNDLNLTGQIGINHVELQSAYAVTSKFALQGQVYSGTKGINAEAGALYFKNLGSRFFIESYLGAGGIVSHHLQRPRSSLLSDDATKWDVETKADKYTAQVFGGIKDSKGLRIGFGVKASYLSYSKYKYEYIKQKYYSQATTYFQYIDKTNYPDAKGVIIEPFIHIGYKRNKFGFFIQTGTTVQSGLKIPIDRQKSLPPLSYSYNQSLKMIKSYFNTGITYNINFKAL